MDHDSSSASVRLPQELTDHILGFLTDDHPALSNCALVAQAWVHTARKHLFSHVRLDLVRLWPAAQQVVPPTPMHISMRQIELHSASLDTLQQCLQRVPSCVQHLTLSPGQYVDSSNPMRSAVTKRLISILKMLPFLKSIDIQMGLWEDYSPDFQAALRHLFAQDSLTAIAVEHGQLTETELASLLPQKPSLVSLSLTAMEIKASPLNTPTLTPAAIQKVEGVGLTSNLDYLHIFGVGILDAITSWFQASRLKAIPLQKLYISERVRNWRSVQQLLDLAGEHLQHLALEGPSRFYDFNAQLTSMDDLSLDNSTNLRKIEILYVEKSEIFSPVPWLASIFSSTSKPLELEVITLNLGVTRISYDIFSAETSWDEWAELDEILSRKEFHKLKLLEINLYHPPSLSHLYVEAVKELPFQFFNLRNQISIKPCSNKIL
ncbi:hypothetical protein CVT26_013921 [Gymnopilus dilepis]|uniref:F-box domain-containing protein n=1 Tax=Gymnopilus dilepis TaxID=231916 RepID=A0A409WT55_9AGAR|nr:hypothetical protein CVT26_013921 [Gymnopilus dilepis]